MANVTFCPDMGPQNGWNNQFKGQWIIIIQNYIKLVHITDHIKKKRICFYSTCAGELKQKIYWKQGSSLRSESFPFCFNNSMSKYFGALQSNLLFSMWCMKILHTIHLCEPILFSLLWNRNVRESKKCEKELLTIKTRSPPKQLHNEETNIQR